MNERPTHVSAEEKLRSGNLRGYFDDIFQMHGEPRQDVVIDKAYVPTSRAMKLLDRPRHVVAGIHIGRMTPMPYVGEFDAVLSVGAEPGLVEDKLRLKHLHLHYGHPDLPQEDLLECAEWVRAQIDQDRTVLIRSEGGRQRPGLITALTVLLIGGTVTDALNCVWKADVQALTDFRYRRALVNMAKAWKKP